MSDWKPNYADAAYHVRERIEEGDYASEGELLELKREYRRLIRALDIDSQGQGK